MDIDRLHYFCVVAQTGSLTKASELLNISQPALSKAIKTLEHEVGERLTIPSGRGIAITDVGHKLILHAQPLIAELLSLKGRLKADVKTKATVKIGSFEVFTTYFLSRILAGPLKDAALEVAELIPGEIEKALLARKVDMGITYMPIPTPELEMIKVATIQMGVYRKKGQFDDLPFEKLPFVCPNIIVEGAPSKAKGLDGWPDHRYPREIVYRVGMMEGALEICRQGYAVGYFPKFVVELHNAQMKSQFALEEVVLPKEVKVNKSQDVYLVKRKTDFESPDFRKLAAEVRKLS